MSLAKIQGQKHKNDRQCTYNVILRRVRVTIVAVGKQELLHVTNVYLYSCLVYPALKVHGMSGLSGSTIFFRIIP